MNAYRPIHNKEAPAADDAANPMLSPQMVRRRLRDVFGRRKHCAGENDVRNCLSFSSLDTAEFHRPDFSRSLGSDARPCRQWGE